MVLNMTSSNSQIDKPQLEHPKRAELSDVNINIGAQSINILRELLVKGQVHLTYFTGGINYITEA